MKKLSLLAVLIAFFATVNAQHFIPLKLLIYPDSLTMAFYGGLSIDKGNGTNVTGTSNTTQTGFVVNALFRKHGNYTYHQFMVDFNPIITNWDPFTWNKLVNQPIDSFMVYKVPYSEDAALHIGWRYNNLSKIYGTQRRGKEFKYFNLFADVYYRPYKLKDDSLDFRFAAFNANLGTQYNYVQKQVPVIGNFLIGVSLQLNFMMINEPDGNVGNFQTITKYNDNLFWGPGGKLIVQTNNLNIYMELREYYGMHTSEKFTQDPTFLVGILGNIQWTSKRAKDTDNGDDDVWMH